MAVLKLLEEREMYGYELVEALRRKTEGVLEMGESTLYPLLYNLEAKTLIRGVWRSESGRRRKYYSVDQERPGSPSIEQEAVGAIVGRHA